VIKYKEIGVIHSPFTSLERMPVQPIAAKGVKGTIEIHKKFLDGLQDLEKFQYIYLFYHFNKAETCKLKVIPFMDDKPHGIFATRAPIRPNPIGISVVYLIKIENNILYVEDIDIMDNTPLLDIKPFIPQVDNRMSKKIGWLQGKENIFQTQSDARFIINKLNLNEKSSNPHKKQTS